MNVVVSIGMSNEIGDGITVVDDETFIDAGRFLLKFVVVADDVQYSFEAVTNVNR